MWVKVLNKKTLLKRTACDWTNRLKSLVNSFLVLLIKITTTVFTFFLLEVSPVELPDALRFYIVDFLSEESNMG